MSNQVKTSAIIVLIAALIAGAGYLIYRLFFGGSGTITVWTIPGNEKQIANVATIFHDSHRDYKVRVVPVAESQYEIKALQALATQKGTDQYPAPDVWVMPNEWLELHRSKLVAAPEGVLDQAIYGYEAERQKGVTPPPRPDKGRTNIEVIKDDYGPIATSDLVRENQVYGVPLQMDTLALFYDRTKINTPPKTWNDVAELTKRFTQRDGAKLTRSTIALGDNTSISHYLDILAILMLQNKTEMVDNARNVATFNISKSGSVPPGTNALDFFTSFAKPNRETFNWTSSLGESVSALNNGKTLMAIGYLNDLGKLGPVGKTDIAIAPLPQVDPNKPQTYGRYLAVTVTKQTVNPDKPKDERKLKAAWELASMFANPDIIEKYATDLRLVPARIDVAKRLVQGPQYKVFSEQVVYAVNWQKRETNVADGALNEALNLVLDNNENPQTALDVASKAYTRFLQADSGIFTEQDILSFWQSSEDPTDYKDLIRNFITDHPDIKRVAISKHIPQRMEWEAINAMAARLGPDILLLPNDAVARFAPMLRGFPKGSFSKSARLDEATSLERNFIPAVVTDNYIEGKLYGMPAHIETLMIAKNNDLFRDLAKEKNLERDKDYTEHQNKFISGPLLWDDLKTMAKIAVKRDGRAINRAFIAIGTGENVEHSDDIYVALVKQFGGEITDPDRNVTGIHLPQSSQKTDVPGEAAEQLYKSFANSDNNFYTWNDGFPNSIEAFADGKVMAAFIYPRDVEKIMARNPRMELKYFPLPQVDITGDAVDVASYYSMTLPRSGKKPTDAIALIKEGVIDRSDRDLNPPQQVLRDQEIIKRQGNPQKLQKNSAQSYYRGVFPGEVEQALIDMLDNKLSLDQAANKINQSLKRTVL